MTKYYKYGKHYIMRRREGSRFHDVYDPKDNLNFLNSDDKVGSWRPIHITRPQKLVEISEEDAFLEMV